MVLDNPRWWWWWWLQLQRDFSDSKSSCWGWFDYQKSVSCSASRQPLHNPKENPGFFLWKWQNSGNLSHISGARVKLIIVLLIARNSDRSDSSPCRHFSRRGSQQTGEVSCLEIGEFAFSARIFDVSRLLCGVIPPFRGLCAVKFGMKWALFDALWGKWLEVPSKGTVEKTSFTCWRQQGNKLGFK